MITLIIMLNLLHTDFASNLLLELNSYSFKIKNGRFRYRFRNRTKINNLTKEIQDEKNEDTKKKVEEEKKILIKIKASIKERDDEIKSKDDQYYFKTKGVPNIKFSGSDKKISIQHLECSFEEREFKELDNPYCVDQGRSSLLWSLYRTNKEIKGEKTRIVGLEGNKLVETEKVEELPTISISKLNSPFLQQVQVPLKLKVGDVNNNLLVSLNHDKIKEINRHLFVSPEITNTDDTSNNESKLIR
ncbi:hypothetical protein ACTFIT_011920 [Dictyostelium discoideum]